MATWRTTRIWISSGPNPTWRTTAISFEGTTGATWRTTRIAFEASSTAAVWRTTRLGFELTSSGQVPSANAGVDDNATPGSLFTFDGSASHTNNGSTITGYAWRYITSTPSGISVPPTILNPTTVNPTVRVPVNAVQINFSIGLTVQDSTGLFSAEDVMVLSALPADMAVAQGNVWVPAGVLTAQGGQWL